MIMFMKPPFCLIIHKQCYCPLFHTHIHGNLISPCSGTEGNLNFYLEKPKKKSSMLLELYKHEDAFLLDSISNSDLLLHWRLSDTLTTQHAPSKSLQRFLFKMCWERSHVFQIDQWHRISMIQIRLQTPREEFINI